MDSSDWGDLIMLGDDIATQWWYLAHPDQTPVDTGLISLPVPGGVARATFNPNLVIVGLVVLGIVLMLNKS